MPGTVPPPSPPRQPGVQPGAVARLPDFITEMETAIISHGRAFCTWKLIWGKGARKMSLLSGAGTALCGGVDVAGLVGSVPAAAFWWWGHLGMVPLAAPSGAPWGCWGGWQRPHWLFVLGPVLCRAPQVGTASADCSRRSSAASLRGVAGLTSQNQQPGSRAGQTQLLWENPQQQFLKHGLAACCSCIPPRLYQCGCCGVSAAGPCVPVPRCPPGGSPCPTAP